MNDLEDHHDHFCTSREDHPDYPCSVREIKDQLAVPVDEAHVTLLVGRRLHQ